MIRSNLARASVLAAVLIMASACSGESSTPTTTTTATAPPTTSAPSSTPPGTLTMGETTGATTGAVKTIEVTYAGGQISGGAQRSTVQLGEKVRIRVTSDVADEVHVHTYDVKAKVAPGQPAELELVASIPGRHEVELEKKGKHLLTLEVR